MAYKDKKTHKAKMSTVRDTKLVKLALGFDFTCFKCSRAFPKNYIFDWQVEHVIPQSFFVNKGEKVNHNFDNLALLCAECNRIESDKLDKSFNHTAKDKKRLAKMQANCEKQTAESIHETALHFCEQSRKFCKGYKSGMYMNRFWA